jgi:hypothetical protein
VTLASTTLASAVPWARAYVDLCAGAAFADNVAAGIAFMEAVIPAVSALPGAPHGKKAAARLEAALRKYLGGLTSASGGVAGSVAGSVRPAAAGVETALRVLCLLVRRGLWAHAPLMPAAITAAYRQKAGIVCVTLEEAGNMFACADDKAAFCGKLERLVMKKTGAAAVVVEQTLNPALIGGCRIYLSGTRYDFSLAGRLKRLETDMMDNG